MRVLRFYEWLALTTEDGKPKRPDTRRCAITTVHHQLPNGELEILEPPTLTGEDFMLVVKRTTTYFDAFREELGQTTIIH